MRTLYPRNPAFYSDVIELQGDDSDLETIRWAAIIQYARVMAHKAMDAYYGGWRGYSGAEQFDTANMAIKKIIADHDTLMRMFGNGSLHTHIDSYEHGLLYGFAEPTVCSKFFLEHFRTVKSESEESQEYFNGSPVRISTAFAKDLGYAFAYTMAHSHSN